MRSLAALLVLALSCSPGGERALVLAARSQDMARVERVAKAFETDTHRSVRLLRVDSAADVLALASRGECDVAALPAEASIERFEAAEHGRAIGQTRDGGLRVVQVNAVQHPKVDAVGAVALANFLAAP